MDEYVLENKNGEHIYIHQKDDDTFLFGLLSFRDKNYDETHDKKANSLEKPLLRYLISNHPIKEYFTCEDTYYSSPGQLAKAVCSLNSQFRDLLGHKRSKNKRLYFIKSFGKAPSGVSGTYHCNITQAPNEFIDPSIPNSYVDIYKQSDDFNIAFLNHTQKKITVISAPAGFGKTTLSVNYGALFRKYPETDASVFSHVRIIDCISLETIYYSLNLRKTDAWEDEVSVITKTLLADLKPGYHWMYILDNYNWPIAGATTSVVKIMNDVINALLKKESKQDSSKPWRVWFIINSWDPDVPLPEEYNDENNTQKISLSGISDDSLILSYLNQHYKRTGFDYQKDNTIGSILQRFGEDGFISPAKLDAVISAIEYGFKMSPEKNKHWVDYYAFGADLDTDDSKSYSLDGVMKRFLSIKTPNGKLFRSILMTAAYLGPSSFDLGFLISCVYKQNESECSETRIESVFLEYQNKTRLFKQKKGNNKEYLLLHCYSDSVRGLVTPEEREMIVRSIIETLRIRMQTLTYFDEEEFSRMEDLTKYVYGLFLYSKEYSHYMVDILLHTAWYYAYYANDLNQSKKYYLLIDAILEKLDNDPSSIFLNLLFKCDLIYISARFGTSFEELKNHVDPDMLYQMVERYKDRIGTFGSLIYLKTLLSCLEHLHLKAGYDHKINGKYSGLDLARKCDEFELSEEGVLSSSLDFENDHLLKQKYKFLTEHTLATQMRAIRIYSLSNLQVEAAKRCKEYLTDDGSVYDRIASADSMTGISHQIPVGKVKDNILASKIINIYAVILFENASSLESLVEALEILRRILTVFDKFPRSYDSVNTILNISNVYRMAATFIQKDALTEKQVSSIDKNHLLDWIDPNIPINTYFSIPADHVSNWSETYAFSLYNTAFSILDYLEKNVLSGGSKEFNSTEYEMLIHQNKALLLYQIERYYFKYHKNCTSDQSMEYSEIGLKELQTALTAAKRANAKYREAVYYRYSALFKRDLNLYIQALDDADTSIDILPDNRDMAYFNALDIKLDIFKRILEKNAIDDEIKKRFLIFKESINYDSIDRISSAVSKRVEYFNKTLKELNMAYS